LPNAYFGNIDLNGGREPYVKTDCSGLVTAARIQEVGVENNDNLRLAWINVRAYVNGYYQYGGEQVDLRMQHISAGEAFRGDLVALRKASENRWRHIAIIDWIHADPETDYIFHAYIVHSRGATPPDQRRVKYDNLLRRYRPAYNGDVEYGGEWYYQFLRFIPE
jgi:hypothetical protein